GNELEKTDLIRVDQPRPGGTLTPETVISGEARGTWFFEGDFPVIVENAAGEVLFITHATAQGDWMTEDFVPFTVTLEEADFGNAEGGTLVLKKDNPSGLPENDDALRVPVMFGS
ncbi:MAG: Gmad2 immunoglobulin-like domain-containing protein, partial [Candidatus Peribacteraceae bacterium]